jgi:hypothetical protein
MQAASKQASAGSSCWLAASSSCCDSSSFCRNITKDTAAATVAVLFSLLRYSLLASAYMLWQHPTAADIRAVAASASVVLLCYSADVTKPGVRQQIYEAM